MSEILKVHQLTKRFDGKLVVDHLNFELYSGRCFGLLGPNGAGKTTTIEMLEGVLSPDNGDIFFNGVLRQSNFQQSIGILFQNTALQERLTVRENLMLFARLYPHSQPVDELLERFSLTELSKRDTRHLSGGQRQRLLLAIALVNDPQLLFLDEPTTGLDPQARMSFWGLIESIKKQGKTILLTTHYMDEAHYLCEEIGILDCGKMIALDTPKALLDHYLPGTYLSVSDHYRSLLQQLEIESESRYGWCRWKTLEVDRQIDQLKQAGLNHADIQVQRPNLDDLFLTLTGRSLRS